MFLIRNDLESPIQNYRQIIVIGRARQIYLPEITITPLFTSLKVCYGAQKNHLIETVLLSTHSISFGPGVRRLIFII